MHSTVSCRRKQTPSALVLRICPYWSIPTSTDNQNINVSIAALRLHLVTWPLSAINRKLGIGCFVMKVLKVSGSAAPAETRSPLEAARFSMTAAAQPESCIIYSARQVPGIQEEVGLVFVTWNSSFDFSSSTSTQWCIIRMNLSQPRLYRAAEAKEEKKLDRKDSHEV